MAQALNHRLSSYSFEMAARFTKSNSPDLYASDLKITADEMIQGDATRYQVSTCFARSEFAIVFPNEGLHGFSLDQGEFEIRKWLEKRSLLQGVAITIEANTRYCLRFGD